MGFPLSPSRQSAVGFSESGVKSFQIHKFAPRYVSNGQTESREKCPPRSAQGPSVGGGDILLP